MPTRTVFFISDGTGITAETFGKAILAQFEMKIRLVRLPFTDTADKAHQAVRQINHTAEIEGCKPIVFTTLVNMEVLHVIRDGCKGMLLDMFGTFVHPLEEELGIKSHHRVGRFSDASKSKEYHDRIDAINFSLAHDDGQSDHDLEGADVILVGVSRSGKTPTRTSNAASCHRPWRPTATSCSGSRSSPSACRRSGTSAGPTRVTPASPIAAWRCRRPRR